jgi:hypothetical protein
MISRKRGSVLSIEFKVSHEPDLLRQYYSLRERCFRQELGLPDFDGSEEQQDRQGIILLALKKRPLCWGCPNLSANHVAQLAGPPRP